MSQGPNAGRRSLLLRSKSERGAVCVRSASTDLCGGCRATGIPTAIHVENLQQGSLRTGFSGAQTAPGLASADAAPERKLQRLFSTPIRPTTRER